ncbi:hypothetical protein AaE_008144 [Aphanomyces astaci]|uniref:Uncharacterized protein n=1 Tax=Aphanomyces astaci TaxID=112090 RepID=A0A6A4ZVN0_APHAT|nr:hypothetical protein AaE_008144 [Aphanomyces astaci]
MQLDVVQPSETNNPTVFRWTIRSVYGDPIVLAKVMASVCDTAKYPCIFGSQDFVPATTSAAEAENATFAQGTATVSFPTSSTYVIAVSAVVGSSAQQYLTTLPVHISLPMDATTKTTELPTASYLPPSMTPLSPPIEATPKAISTTSTVLIIVGAVLAVVVGTVFAILFYKLRKARASMSSSQQSSATSTSQQIELDTMPTTAAAEPFRRVHVATTFNSTSSSVVGGPSASYASAANHRAAADHVSTTNSTPPCPHDRPTRERSHNEHSSYVKVTDEGIPPSSVHHPTYGPAPNRR